MKKINILIVSFLILFLQINTVQALSSEETKERYSGSIILDDFSMTNKYWYLEPSTQERFYLRNGKSISRLLKKYSIDISNDELNKIALNKENSNTDYKLTRELRGYLLKTVNNKYWYIDPLTGYRHQILNGQKGLDTLKELVIKLKKEDLDQLPINNSKSFHYKDLAIIDLGLYNNVWNTLKNNYYQTNKIKEKEMFYGSLGGLANSFDDPYTKFFAPEERKEFDNKMEGSLEGIGAMVEEKDGLLIIVSPLDNSPAQKAGLLPQDQVLEVDNINIHNFSLEKSISLIKGKKGSTVHLKVYRPKTNKIFEIDIIREKIIIPNIIGEELDDNIAYFKVNLFSLNLHNEFAELKNKLINENTKGIILDLRNNPGGYTSAAINLADNWLNRGDLIFQEKYPNIIKQYVAGIEKEIDLPTIILTNNGTASASEIVTSALKEHQEVTVVGETTFGKGTGQGLSYFNDGSALKYTVFEWLTPHNNRVEGLGIEPDYIIENDAIDRQLNKAKELLK